MNLSLIKKRIRPIRALPGFKKNHRIPSANNHHAETFVAEITAEEIKADLNLIYTGLRKEFHLRRADMKVSHEHGTGAIDTGFFQYSVDVTLNPDQPGEVIWRQQVTEIRDRIQVLSGSFERVFTNRFDTVEYLPPEEIDIDDFIDRIEELEDERLKIHYDIEGTDCRVEIDGVSGQVEVRPNSISLTQSTSVSPKDLVQAFLDMQEMMGYLRVE